MWPLFDYLFSGYGATNGHVNLVTPEGAKEEIEIPESLAMLNEKVCTSMFRIRDKSRLYVAGGMTDNAMITEQRHLVRQFIAPMSEELVEDATPATGQIGFEKVAAAAGLNGACIFFLRWRDSLHDRRSPFSGRSPTIQMDGASALVIRGLPTAPTPDDYCVDEIELWCNRDGENLNGELVIRRIAARDSGVSTVTITEYIEGEPETASNLQKAPRCRFNLVYHNRLYQWGNDLYPDRVFASVLNRCDEFGGLYLATLNGEPIIGGVVVRDTLVLFGPQSCYTVIGYSDRDLKMKLLEPDVGCINHFGIKMIDDVAYVPTHKGLALCTGTSMILLAGGYERFWAAHYARDPDSFHNGYAVNDKVSGLYKFFQAQTSAFSYLSRYWVFDYASVTSQPGASIVPPLLSFDMFAGSPPVWSDMLSKPGSRDAACYVASADGVVYRENAWDAGGDEGGSTPITVTIHPFMLSEDGGGAEDGMKLHEMWFFISNHGNGDTPAPETFDLTILDGNEWAANVGWPDGPSLRWLYNTTAMLLSVDQQGGGTLYTEANGNPVKFETPAGAGVTHYAPALVLPNINLSAEGFSPVIEVIAPRRLCYRGFGCNVSPGKKKAHLALTGD